MSTGMNIIRRAIKSLPQTLPLISYRAPTYTVTFLRHGQSEWNEKNLFTGWYDTKLTERGLHEAACAADTLRRDGLVFDTVFTSPLTRAEQTMDVIVQEQQHYPQIVRSWRLNERHFGGLVGMNKNKATEIFGATQVRLWQRGFRTQPPPMLADHPYYAIIKRQFGENFTRGESLENTLQRVVPYWHETIVPAIRRNERVLIVAHNSSLRALIKHIDGLSDEEISECNVPSGVPFSYTFDLHMQPIRAKRMCFHGDAAMVQRAQAHVAELL